MKKWVQVAITGAIVLGATGPLMADVKSGVDAWQRGDYSAAVSAWRGPAEASDPDAQFNLGQAYKLGRGVPNDMDQALEWFRRAAAQGHSRAEDNYGLLLFQQNRRSDAMPYIQKSANRGEPRAQYILGTALFNGEFVSKDWVRAYAMMSRAASSGLPQATTSLTQMEKFIPDSQKRQGRAMADTLASQSQLASADAPSASNSYSASPSNRYAPPPPARGDIRTTELPPSSANNWRDRDVASAQQDDYPPPPPTRTPPLPPRRVDVPVPPAPRPAPVKPAVAAPAPAASGGWRVQLGAFSEEGRAKSLWGSLKGRVNGLSAYQPYLVKGGTVTRLQAGPLRSEAEANRLCASIKSAGSDCIPKKM